MYTNSATANNTSNKDNKSTSVSVCNNNNNKSGNSCSSSNGYACGAFSVLPHPILMYIISYTSR